MRFFSLLYVTLVLSFSGPSKFSPTSITSNLHTSTLTKRDFYKAIKVIFRDYEAHYLIPFTKKSDLVRCQDVFDFKTEYLTALSCFNQVGFPEDKLIDPPIPECYVIKTSSADVMESEDKSFSYISPTFLNLDRVLGFYEDQIKTMFIVENYDQSEILRHELGHYFLDLKTGDGNGRHDNVIWGRCESAKYTPSNGALESGSKKLTQSEHN